MPSEGPKLPPPSPLAFGAADHVEALVERIEQHFAASGRARASETVAESTEKPLEDSLVVGLFGEWGSGKSLWLRHIEHHFLLRLASWLEGDGAPTGPLIVPVFFNTWRYEKEEHLVIPLIKTLETRLHSLAPAEDDPAQDAEAKGKKGFLDRAANALAIAGIALASGLSGKLSVPLLGEVELSGSDVVDTVIELVKLNEAEEAARNDALTRVASRGEEQGKVRALLDLQSVYYDFQAHLRGITRPEREDGRPLNLLFLIDDLDRCLPEKAVEMLETIKLFLDVEGTAFVLALDDAVVERGIAHRYRDYGFRKHPTAYDSIAYAINPANYEDHLKRYKHLGQEPINGHEYLEKIVQLPVRIPRPNVRDLRDFLLENFGDVFSRTAKAEEEREGGRERGLAKEKVDAAGGDFEHDAPVATRIEAIEPLLELFTKAVPPVPRKHIRAAELLRVHLGVARRRGWDLHANDTELLTLARLTLVQIFAPEVYRYAQRRDVRFLARMAGWVGAVPDWRLEGWLEAFLSKRKKDYEAKGSNSDAWAIEHYDLPLLRLLREAQAQRSGFDPFDVVDPPPDLDPNLGDYFVLARTAQDVRAQEVSSEGLDRELPEVNLNDPEGFLNLLLAEDPERWEDALQNEGLKGVRGRLPDYVFAEILEKVRERPGQATVDWLDTLSPLLSTEQLRELVSAAGVFERLLEGANAPGKEPQ